MKHTKLRNFFIIAFLVCFLIPTFSVNSFASTTYTYIPTTDFSIDMFTQEANQGGAITHYNNTIQTRGPLSIGGVVYYGFKNTDSNFAGTGKTHNLLMIKLEDLSLKDEYTIEFVTRISNNVAYAIEVYLTDNQGQYLTVLGYDAFTGNASANNLTQFNFTLDGLNLNTNNGVYLNILMEYGSQYSSNNEFLISAITLVNLDDDTGFFESIIAWIQQVANNITNIGTNIVNKLTNVSSNIVSSVSTLGSNLNTWLGDVKDGIVNKLQNVQTAITNAIDGIQQWFINLGQQIGDFFTMLKNYILYFQHPVTLNADGVPVDSNGNPVYTNPFSTLLSSITDTLDEWFDDLDNFILSIQSTNQQITSYLTTFTNIFNRFNTGVPLISVILTLALIIIVIRKILGR